MRVLYIEPFEGGSHAAFSRALSAAPGVTWTRLTLPGRHWKWRMRGSAAFFASSHRDVLRGEFDLVFASSFLPLAELVGLVPELAGVPSLLYFHENQLAYPWRTEPGERDYHFAFTQIVSALAATRCVFNSAYNRDSFMREGAKLLARMPDARLSQWAQTIGARSQVLGVPLELADVAPVLAASETKRRARGPLILWNHRWEHDKNPDAFFAALDVLCAQDVPFELAVCGERYRRCPAVFEQLPERFAHRLVHLGYAEDRGAYEDLLRRADLVVSSANHEFFGVSVLEATHFGARPVVPNRLAYPELFPETYRYEDDAQLAEHLAQRCAEYCAGQPMRQDRRELTRPLLAAQLLPRYVALFKELQAG